MYIVQFLACCRTFNSECFFRLHFIVVNFCSVTHVVCVNIPILSVPHSFCSSRSYCVNENILTPCSLNLLKYDVSTFKITLSPTQNEITFIFNTTSIYECCMWFASEVATAKQISAKKNVYWVADVISEESNARQNIYSSRYLTK